jgi:O-methyltransferase
MGRILRALLARRGATIVHFVHEPARRDLSIVRYTRVRSKLLVDDIAAFEILACVRACRHRGGAMAEAGVFAGGTARLICEMKGDVPLLLFDVFETLQGQASPVLDSARAGELRAVFGAWHAPRAAVDRLLAGYPSVRVYPGLFPESARQIGEQSFSFVHLDLDLESCTRDALAFFYPRLLPGGIILGDDYNLKGVRRAFDDYFSERSDTVIGLPWGQALVVKSAG